ncbi:MAG: ThuA domain-containing protein [Rubripirellula sp.]
MIMVHVRLLWLVLGLVLVTYRGKADELPSTKLSNRPHVVMLVAEREYETMQSLKQFSKDQKKAFRFTIVAEDSNDRNRLIGLDSLQTADLMLVSVRRRTLPSDQLALIRKFISQGKPVIGIRTASHAFSLRNKKPPEGRADWQDFDQVVFGGNYTNHYGNDLQVKLSFADAGLKHSIVKGIDAEKSYLSSSSLYRVSPLMKGAKVLMRGQVKGHRAEPVAWTYRRADGGKSFYTSLGNTEDFQGLLLPALLENAMVWGLSK